MARVIRLTLLAPNILEGIVDGRIVPGLAGFLLPITEKRDEPRSS